MFSAVAAGLKPTHRGGGVGQCQRTYADGGEHLEPRLIGESLVNPKSIFFVVNHCSGNYQMFCIFLGIDILINSQIGESLVNHCSASFWEMIYDYLMCDKL